MRKPLFLQETVLDKYTQSLVHRALLGKPFKKNSREAFIVIRYDGYWESQMHVRKTLRGMISYLQREPLVSAGGFKIYRIPISESQVIYDSKKGAKRV